MPSLLAVDTSMAPNPALSSRHKVWSLKGKGVVNNAHGPLLDLTRHLLSDEPKPLSRQYIDVAWLVAAR